MSHYYINDKSLKENIKTFEVDIASTKFVFKTDNGVFSKDHIDFATNLLITSIDYNSLRGDILDLGSGYGVIGIYFAKVTNNPVDQIDINEKAVNLTRENAKLNNVETNAFESDGFSKVNKLYDYIITNPPIRVGKQKMYELINSALDHLKDKGFLWLVLNKKHGAKSFMSDFSNRAKIEVINKDKGFYILKLSSN